MNSLPILFTGEMVLALLNNALPKTQTRRLAKHQPPHDVAPIRVGLYEPIIVGKDGEEEPGPEIFGAYDDDGQWGLKCPYGRAGDQLWVRESFSIRTHVRDKVTGRVTVGGRYIAGDTEFEIQLSTMETVKFLAWHRKLDVHPNLFMFRSLSRVTLEIKGCRFEQVQAITNDDARAEGCPHAYPHRHGPDGIVNELQGEPDQFAAQHNTGFNDCWICAYRELWDSINGAGSWRSNPWVWAVDFNRIKP